MVGIAGFEPATSRPPDERATRLRYTPTTAVGLSGWLLRCQHGNETGFRIACMSFNGQRAQAMLLTANYTQS